MNEPEKSEQSDGHDPETEPQAHKSTEAPSGEESPLFTKAAFESATDGVDDVILEDLLSALLDAEAERQTAAPRRREARRQALEKSRFVLPAKSAALGAVVVAIICLAALVLVTEAEGANALATLALALALLSFVIQVMVFVYQSQTSNQQMLQAEQLYTETRTLLTEVRTAANSTETLVRDQFQDLLKAFMEAAPGSGEGEPFDSAAFERKLVETLRTEIREPEGSSQASAPRPAATALSRARAQRDRRRRELLTELLRFPDEAEGKPALATLQQLTAGAVNRLHALITDELQIRRSDRGAVLGLPWSDIDEELRTHGLAMKARVRLDGEATYVARTTEQGRLAGRLLIATGEVPDYAVNGIPEVQEP